MCFFPAGRLINYKKSWLTVNQFWTQRERYWHVQPLRLTIYISQVMVYVFAKLKCIFDVCEEL